MPKKLDAELPPTPAIMVTLSLIAANSLSTSKPPGEACMEAVIKAASVLYGTVGNGRNANVTQLEGMCEGLQI